MFVLSWRHGATYYFCSDWCRDRFTADPERYIAGTTGGTPSPALKAGLPDGGEHHHD